MPVKSVTRISKFYSMGLLIEFKIVESVQNLGVWKLP
jgi:hypothetical protein